MKTIEELSLSNIVLIEKYLSGEMSPKEALEFENRLKDDKELCDDFEMISDEFGKMGFYHHITTSFHSTKDGNIHRLDRKQKVGRSMIGNGLLALALVFMMVAVCAILIALAS